jgi:hypothetical protein
MLAALSAGAAAQPTIADLAPEQSFLVASVPDWAAMEEAFGRTPLGGLWRERELQDFIKRATEAPMEELRGALAEIDTELDELRTPVGAAGVAMYFLPDDPTPRALVMADYGDRAEAMRAVLDRLLDKGVEDDAILVDEEEHEGATILTIKIVREEAEEEPDHGEGDEEWEEWEEPDPIGDFLGATSEVTLAIREGVFLLSPDAETVDRALEALGGGGIDAAAGAEGYLAARSQHAEDLDAFVVLRTGPLMDVLTAGVAEQMEFFAPEGFEAGPMLEAVGLMSLEALSVGMRFDTPEAALEQTVGVLAREPKGLLALMSSKAVPLNPPAFIGGDAAEYSQYTFDFAGLLDAARAVIAALPEDARAQAEPQFEQGVAPMLAPLLGTLGPEVYVSKTYTKPLDVSSARAFVAIPTKDEAIVNNLVAAVPFFRAGQVQGNMIYAIGMGEMGVLAPDAALGIGAGHVVIGNRDDVQDALRQAANPEGPRLATEDRYRRAVAPLSDPGLWYGYREFGPTYEWMLWQFENMEQMQRAQMEQMGMSAEDIDEMMGYMGDAQPAWAKDLPPASLLREFVGDMSFELHAAPDGMRGRWLLLRPEE